VAHRKRGKGNPLVKVLSVFILIVMTAFSGLSSLPVHGNEAFAQDVSYPKIWFADFESGDHAPYFTASEVQDPCGPNYPGEITNFSHTGRYAGYYYDSPHTSDLCRSYYNVNFNSVNRPQIPDTKDFYVEVWVYVPSTGLSLPRFVSFVSIKFGPNYKGIMIDSSTTSKGALYIYDDLFNDTCLMQSDFKRPIKAYWPFDKWFKIGVEVHYRPSDQISQVVLYQDDLEILNLQTHATNPNPLPFKNLHFGLYTGGNQTFALYNDDIALYDLTQSPTTTTTTTTSTSNSTTSPTYSQTQTYPASKVITSNGPLIDTAQSQFGGASGLFDGTGDYLTAPSSTDWGFGTGDFTLDLWFRLKSLPSNSEMDFLAVTSTKAWSFHIDKFGTQFDLAFYCNVFNPTSYKYSAANMFVTGTWYHVAVVKTGSTIKLFIGGTQVGGDKTITSNYNNWSTDTLYVGSTDASTNFFNGWLDEVRVSKGIARWTSNFVPPTAPYVRDSSTVLLLHMDGANGSTTFIDDMSTSQTTTTTTTTSSSTTISLTITTTSNSTYLVVKRRQ